MATPRELDLHTTFFLSCSCFPRTHWTSCAIVQSGSLLCRHYYSKAVQANPYHAVAHFNLGLLLHDEDIETAMEHYQVRYLAVEVCLKSAHAHAVVRLSVPVSTSRTFHLFGRSESEHRPL